MKFGFLVVCLLAVVSAISCNRLMSIDAPELAQCMTQNGVKLYSAEWCPSCASQKALFGEGVKHLRIIECSKSPGREECAEAKIKSIPTWSRPDGDRLVGVRGLDELADWSGCR